MATLTNEQLAFLRDQGISLSQVFDASGLRAKERISKMDAIEAPFYYGGALCQAKGHSLRTKPGHCIQCDTSKIAYQLRNAAAGHIYLAYSQSRQYAKVGYTKTNPDERIAFLRRENYGNATDWQLKQSVLVSRDAGRREFEVHAKLEAHRKPVVYEKYEHVLVECREIFACPLSVASEAFCEALR
jgi:hypothetical protein